MPFRVSILDLTAAIVVLVVIILPDRSLQVSAAYEADPDQLREIALYQARMAADARDTQAAAELSERLVDVKQTDWGVRVASESAAVNPDTAWLPLLAVSMAHAERVEVSDAHKFAERSITECRKAGELICPPHEEARISIYYGQLDAGLKSGIDPRQDPDGYSKAVAPMLRMINNFRGATPSTPEPETPPSTPEPTTP